MSASPFESSSDPQLAVRQDILMGAKALVSAVDDNPALTFGDWVITPGASPDDPTVFFRGKNETRDTFSITDNGDTVNLSYKRVRSTLSGILIQNIDAAVSRHHAKHVGEQWEEEARPKFMGYTYDAYPKEPLKIEDPILGLQSMLDGLRGLQGKSPDEMEDREPPRRHSILARFRTVGKLLGR